MSYGYGADHSHHEYADSRHDHDRYDVPAIRDLENQANSDRNACRSNRDEMWEHIHELSAEIGRLRGQVKELTEKLQAKPAESGAS